jgi:hypothetical protein
MGVLHSNLTYVGVAYWDKLVDISPVFNRTALFQNPAPNSAVNFATVRVFVPTRRLRWWSGSVGGTPGTSPTSIGGVPGNIQTIGSYTPGTPGTTVWQVGRDGSGENPPGIPDASDDWSLWNQNWTAQLVPTVEANLLTILTTQPSVPGFTGNVQLPNLGGVGSADLSQISPH